MKFFKLLAISLLSITVLLHAGGELPLIKLLKTSKNGEKTARTYRYVNYRIEEDVWLKTTLDKRKVMIEGPNQEIRKEFSLGFDHIYILTMTPDKKFAIASGRKLI